MPHLVDLGKYAERIGFTGEFKVDFATLATIQQLHTCSIPFENLDVTRGMPITLEPEHLEEKLVTQRRGGYCFEQNGLLLEVLSQIGFKATPMAARVRIGNPRDYLPPRTHLFLLVELDGKTWIIDAGVGGMSLTSPIEFVVDTVQETLHEPRRITLEHGVYYHQINLGSKWEDVYEFRGEEMPMIDREVSNWWTSTCASAKFKINLFCALASLNGERRALLNGVFTHRMGPDVLREVTITSDEHFLEVLAAEFGLIFPAGTNFGQTGCPWKQPTT